MSDQSKNRTYRGSGMTRVRYTTRQSVVVWWAETAFETRNDCYRARRYADGTEAFYHNGTTITTRGRMPNTIGTRLLFVDFDSANFASYHSDATRVGRSAS